MLPMGAWVVVLGRKAGRQQLGCLRAKWQQRLRIASVLLAASYWGKLVAGKVSMWKTNGRVVTRRAAATTTVWPAWAALCPREPSRSPRVLLQTCLQAIDATPARCTRLLLCRISTPSSSRCSSGDDVWPMALGRLKFDLHRSRRGSSSRATATGSSRTTPSSARYLGNRWATAVGRPRALRVSRRRRGRPVRRAARRRH